MLKENRKTLIITSLVTIIPAVIGAVLWDRLPDVMATHFGLDNTPDGFSNKVFTVFGIPAIMLALLWACAFITAHDPKKQNISRKMFSLVLWIIPVISLLMAAILYPYNLGYRMDMTFIMGIVIGLMFVITGNYMPKARRNYTIGIKVPWTLADDDNWDRTHRLAGFVWVAGGLSVLAMTFMGIGNLAAVIISVTVIMVLIPVVYSFVLYLNKR
ncbi:MAG: SdpI family protein [Eubacterium sp.]|nr:SdpI family protein [Eubacterium sp.]